MSPEGMHLVEADAAPASSKEVKRCLELLFIPKTREPSVFCDTPLHDPEGVRDRIYALLTALGHSLEHYEVRRQKVTEKDIDEVVRRHHERMANLAAAALNLCYDGNNEPQYAHFARNPDLWFRVLTKHLAQLKRSYADCRANPTYIRRELKGLFSDAPPVHRADKRRTRLADWDSSMIQEYRLFKKPIDRSQAQLEARVEIQQARAKKLLPDPQKVAVYLWG